MVADQVVVQGGTQKNAHMSGDATLFDALKPIPSKFFVKQIMGKVAVTQWGTVRLQTDGINGTKKKLV